jgi:acyl-[acyl carrier protein]--UDP-N-acetylglucosamine O-acyltransferase
MPRTLLNLPELLAAHGAALGVVEVREPGLLDRVQQTGFAWTRQPGVACLAANRAWFAIARDNPDVIAIVAPSAVAARESAAGKAVIVCDPADALYHFLHASQALDASPVEPDIDPSAILDASAIVRGAVRIDAGARIGPRVVIDGPAVVGRDARIDAGAVIGCDGLYVKQILGTRMHMPHLGGVEIGAGAHVHAGAVLVRSAVRGEHTRIGAGAHVGVLTNIGHDVEVGEAATISSNCVLAGRARIGARAWIGASVSISNMVRIGDDAQVRIGAVVIQDVPDGGEVSGNFALPHARNMKRHLRDSRHDA